MTIPAYNFADIFTKDVLNKLFPEDRANQFFDALFGDVSEGAYDIALEFREYSQNSLEFEFHLKRRPDKCLACNLTYGLPNVFSRHPVINVKRIIQEIDNHLNGQARCIDWRLGHTREVSRELHIIPLSVFVE